MTPPLPGTTLRDDVITNWKRVTMNKGAIPVFPDEQERTNVLEIQTFTITRVVEFDGFEVIDDGVTIEFYGSHGPIETIALDSTVASFLRDALTKAVV